MRTGAGTGVTGLSYLLPDHLGSPAVTVNAADTNAVARTGYKPWGEERYGAAPSTFGYTGQRDEPDLDILYYGARWYDSYLNRFLSPDSIVPGVGNPLAWDRYAYSSNNPVNNIDPSGHFAIPVNWGESGSFSIGAPELIIIAIVAIGAIAAIDDSRRRHGVNEYSKPGTSLAESFQNHEMQKFSNDQKIDEGEFTGMLDAIDADLDTTARTPIDLGRADYDTPFFDGNGRSAPKEHNDVTVCIAEKCSPQSAVNYVAQGMYSASAGESIDSALGWPQIWNQVSYQHDATPDELYWTEYGYNYYKQKNQGEMEQK